MSLTEIVKNSLCIVTYHKVSYTGKLRAQLEHAKYKRVLVTVDDGDPSFYQVFYPEATRLQIPVVLFVVTSLIETEQPFWWDEVVYYLGEAKGNKEVRRLKSITNQERLQYLKTLKANSNKAPLKYQQLSVAQLQEMQAAGVLIANHSHTHPMFDQCTEEEIRAELRASKAFFTQHGLKGYEYFAYPNGNYNERVQKILIEEGIQYAFLFDHQLNKAPINPMRISRLSVNDDTPLWKLRLILSGWHSRILPLRRKIFNLFS
jgi:poly-beta-1,6-N-acetyl-D-glucosamine N-deacetylase